MSVVIVLLVVATVIAGMGFLSLRADCQAREAGTRFAKEESDEKSATGEQGLAAVGALPRDAVTHQ